MIDAGFNRPRIRIVGVCPDCFPIVFYSIGCYEIFQEHSNPTCDEQVISYLALSEGFPPF